MSSEQEQKKPLGLWSVIGGTGSPVAEVPPADAPDNPDDATHPPHGLWALMQRDAASIGETRADDLPNHAADPAPDTRQPAGSRAAGDALPDERQGGDVSETPHEGLWRVMGLAPRTTVESPAARRDKSVSRPAPSFVTALPRELPSGWVKASRRGPSGLSSGAVWSLCLAVASIPAAALAVFPDWFLKLPATLLGFWALLAGLTAYSEIRRSGGRQTGKGFAIAGILLGTVGMFLDPLVVLLQR